jgi:hypothetical protein
MKQICRNTLLSLLALMLVFGTVGPSVSAAPMTTEEVEELAANLEFLMEEAAIFYAEGSVIGFDFDKLEAKFGKVKEFDMLEQEINSASSEDLRPR